MTEHVLTIAKHDDSCILDHTWNSNFKCERDLDAPYFANEVIVPEQHENFMMSGLLGSSQ